MHRFIEFIRTGWQTHKDNRIGGQLAGISWINDRDDARISCELAAIQAHR